jgi:hypothetical protein
MTNAIMVTVDHIWPGSQDAIRAKAETGNLRAAKAYEGLLATVGDIVKGVSLCTQCASPISTTDDLGCCSVAVLQDKIVIAIPICTACLAGDEQDVRSAAASRIAKVALSDLMDKCSDQSEQPSHQ